MVSLEFSESVSGKRMVTAAAPPLSLNTKLVCVMR